MLLVFVITRSRRRVIFFCYKGVSFHSPHFLGSLFLSPEWTLRCTNWQVVSSVFAGSLISWCWSPDSYHLHTFFECRRIVFSPGAVLMLVLLKLLD